MKRLFFIGILALLLGAWLFQKIASGSGYVLVSLGNTAYEMSFWTAVGLLLGGSVSLLLIYWLISALVNVFMGGTRRILNVGRKNSQARSARGLIYFIEGNWKQAKKHLLKSVNHSPTPMINYLAAARSTYELGNHEEAIELLHLAEKSNPDSALAVALTQARMYLADQKYEQCMANLKRAQEIAPHHPVVLELLQQTYRQLCDWKALRDLLPDLRRYKILEESAIVELETEAFVALLKKSGEKGALEAIDKQWDATPKVLKKNTSVFIAYIEQLLRVGDDARAENLVRKQINQNWDESLVNWYGLIDGKDSQRQYLFAKDWQKGRPGNATLLLTLGRLALRNQQWQEAQDYLLASIKLQKQADNCGELARLLQALGETNEATQYYQMALSQTKAQLPDLPLPERAHPVAEQQPANKSQNPSLRAVSDS